MTKETAAEILTRLTFSMLAIKDDILALPPGDIAEGSINSAYLDQITRDTEELKALNGYTQT